MNRLCRAAQTMATKKAVVEKIDWRALDAIMDTAAPVADPTKDPIAPLEQGRLLIVDDSAESREILAMLCEKIGHLPTSVESGEAALELMRTKEFDVIILDIMMPGMDGYEVLRRLKEDTATRDTPVLILSGYTELDSIVRCIKLGAEDYLPKPFKAILLKARIGACLEKKRLRDRDKFIIHQLEEEQKKSDKLLLNILPGPIADRLKQGEEVIVDSFASVTVLFADLVGFSQLAARLSPNELVRSLNDVFSRFDFLARQFGLEKIKTIGDAYMAVAGVPERCDNHAERAADMALAMQDEIQSFNQQSGHSLTVRIGMHSGPVVAGVIGTHKFTYDLWGDTVNIASRMESHGHPSAIQVSENTERILRSKFLFITRGRIQIKGQGELMTYLLGGKLG
jgi:adenylate cyclase